MARLRNQYGFWGTIHMVWWLIKSKCICKDVRLLRFPITIHGKRLIDFGQRLTTGCNCRLEAYSLDGEDYKRLIFGNDVQINDNVHFDAMKSVIIGDNVLMASHVFISDNSHGSYGDRINSNPNIPPMERDYNIEPVNIGKNVWIGEGAFISMGVTIGKGCIIGAHAFVNRSIPDYCIAVGSPAKVIKKFDFDKLAWCQVDNS